MFNDIFQVESTGNRIDLLTHEGRNDINEVSLSASCISKLSHTHS
jgi:hypothetical protein